LLSALLDEIFDTGSHIAARDEIFQQPAFIVSITTDNCRTAMNMKECDGLYRKLDVNEA